MDKEFLKKKIRKYTAEELIDEKYKGLKEELIKPKDKKFYWEKHSSNN